MSEIVATPEIDRFPPEALPMRDFGLDPPQGTITLELDAGERRTLQIGALTVTTSALYARVLPSPDVFQIGSLIFNDVAAALFRLRDARRRARHGGSALKLLGDWLRTIAREDGARDAFVYRDARDAATAPPRRLTYAAWDRRSDAIAAGLAELGFVEGDVLALLLPPRVEYPLCYLAAAKIGVITTGVNPRFGDGEIDFILRDSGARAVVTTTRQGERELAALVRRLGARIPTLRHVVVVDGERAADGKALQPRSRGRGAGGPAARGARGRRGRGRSVAPPDAAGGRLSLRTTSRRWSTPAAPRAGPRAPPSPSRTSRRSGRRAARCCRSTASARSRPARRSRTSAS